MLTRYVSIKCGSIVLEHRLQITPTANNNLPCDDMAMGILVLCDTAIRYKIASNKLSYAVYPSLTAKLPVARSRNWQASFND